MKRFGIIAAALLASACIPDKITNTDKATQNPSTPTGSIVGVVTNMSTGAALAGVTVTTMNESGAFVTDTTDSSGAYALTGLRAGVSYNLKYAATGFTTRLTSATVDDNAGNFPSPGLTEVNVQLPPSTGSVAGTVYYTDGSPAGGVTLVVDLRASGYDLVTTATSNTTTGDFTISGLPATLAGFTVTVRTEPWDSASPADGVVDFGTGAYNVTLFPGVTAPLFVDLRPYAVALVKLFANTDSGTLLNTLPIEVTFNRELDLAATTASLYDYDAGRYVALNLALDTTGKILSLTPNDGTLLAAFHDFYLSVSAKAPNGDTEAYNKDFQSVTASTLLGDVTNLVVTPAANAVNFNTTGFTLSWDELPGAFGYRVYVRDNSRNPSWLLVATPGTSLTPGATISLPGTFDYYSSDAYQTPFLWGVDVEFAVVAVNQAGEAPLPSVTTATATRSDTVVPTITSAMWANYGYLDNRGSSTAKTVTLPVTFSEYMDRNTDPVLTGLPAAVTTAWDWSANTMGGTYTLTIPAGSDGGVNATLTVTGGKDTSNNTMTTLTISDLISNGGFESAGIGGWYTTLPTGWAVGPTPIATNATSAIGTYSARLGDLGGVTTTGYSMISQDFTVPSGAKNIQAQIAVKTYTDEASTASYFCYIANSTGGALYYLYSAAGAYAGGTITASPAGFTTYYTSISTGYSGTSLMFRCYAYDGSGTGTSGIYIDNASVVVSR